MIITKEFNFDAAHRLPNVPDGHKCKRLHGHTYRVTLEVEGTVEPLLGWVVDFEVIAGAWTAIHGLIDHRYLNEIEGLEIPTSEVLAPWILRRLLTFDLGRARFVALTLHESSTTTCRVTEADIPAHP